MKKRLKQILLILSIVILACCLWLYGYKTHKNPDNIPTKELLVTCLKEKGEAQALREIEGFRRDILLEIWQEPDGSLFGFYGDIWTAENGELVVYYDEDSRVTGLRCRSLQSDTIVSQSTYTGTITGILTESEDPNVSDNVPEVKTERGEILYFTLTEESQVIGTAEVGSAVSIRCEEYSYTGYQPIISITIE